jgi:hypothetical protein
MMARAQIAHRHVPVSGPRDAPAAEDAIGVAINEQREPHVRRELTVATTLFIDGEGRERQPLDGLDHEVHQIILAHPGAQVRRQQHGSVAVDVS